jgi:hypothetical protein
VLLKQSSGRNFSLISVGNKNTSPPEPKFTAFTYGTRWAPARRSRGSLRARPGGCCSASRKALATSLDHNRPPLLIRAHKLNYPLALIAPFSHPKVDALAALAARLHSHPFAAQWLQQNCDLERRPPSVEHRGSLTRPGVKARVAADARESPPVRERWTWPSALRAKMQQATAEAPQILCKKSP